MSVAILSPQERIALDLFAAAEGRRWRSRLTEVFWYNARIWVDQHGSTGHGTVLHGLRNRPGGYDAVSQYRPVKQ